jgi:hypothetical protein
MLDPDSLVEKLKAERSRLQSERERLDGLIAGLDLALRLAGNSATSPQLQIRQRRSSGDTIKGFVFGLIGESDLGLGSSEVLAEADRRGRPLNRNTITSMLSASASKGLLELVDGRYRIPKGIPEAATASGSLLQPNMEAAITARKVGGT